ncbi:8-oxoguanine deaminase [Mangrovactinospora gilvigrisea]|uniref:8-oxoguanine deaminase n=1 Tax=Mangrovactinospora gilvigrisea TaxID=1428644 RepID=A0A1J7C4I8_9ACTN|nr:8-oxoguanine deaminase [Mangrovactinospora gilvigrisea]OIV36476.1 8-oxoguanine deaminase [Mangrovactinospora gilvigrisea]
MTRTLITNAHVATVDADDTEFASADVLLEGNRIAAVGPGLGADGVDRTVDAGGRLLTPGLVNTHHHFYQWLTRGLATDRILFDWLTALYPTWARIDAGLTHTAARGSLAALALTGCTTASDHHYVFPREGGDCLAAEIEAAARTGIRFTACRGSMDLGESDGGLPPDFAVEETEQALAATEAAVDRWHDPSFGSMLHIAVAPCSPFSVTAELLKRSAELARRKGVRLHTHGSETVEEAGYLEEKTGQSPTEYLESNGWLGEDVWMAHCVHLSDGDIVAFARTGTGVAHCPSSNGRLGAGIARTADLLRAGVPVGYGVDGTASNESGELGSELRNSLLVGRIRSGADALTARDALRIGTMGGARVLGRQDEIGSIEAGKLADLVLWDTSTFWHSSIADPVAALALGALPRIALSLVDGRPVVEDGHLVTDDEDDIARATRAGARELASRG